MSLSATWATYEVEPVSRDGYSLGVHLVRHPTAREAICILEHAQDPSEDAWHLIRGALRSWLPLRLYSILVSKRMSRRSAVGIATQLLAVGLTAKEEKTQKKIRTIPWNKIVSDYRHIYPQSSLDEPWPFFLEQAAQMDRIRALDTLDATQAAAIGHSGSRKMLDSLQRRAGYEDQYDEEEAIRRQKASLAKIKGIHHQVSKGKTIGRA